jgi:hypothetical protein
MKHTREQKRAKLLAAAQAVIEEFLDWEAQAAQPKLTAIEDGVLQLREQFGQRLAEVALADQDAKQPVTPSECPSCGQPMRYKGQKGLEVESRVGLLSIDRGHYYCARCHSGLFPPG